MGMGGFVRSTAIVTALVVLVVSICLPQVPKFMYPADDSDFNLEKFIAERNSVMNHEGWNIVVTGANSGLGYATVEHMSRLANTRIIMACRSMKKCETARQKLLNENEGKVLAELVCQQLDLASKESIQDFSETFKDSDGEIVPIHVLVNNGGIFAPSGQVEYSEDGLETHIMTNHLGHVLLTHNLWRNLVKVKARIVNVSSITAIFPYAAGGRWLNTGYKNWIDFVGSALGFLHGTYYVRSKRCNLLFTAELAHRYPAYVTATAAHPGYTLTEIFLHKKHHEEHEGTAVVHEETPWNRRILYENKIANMVPSEGSLSQVRAALDPMSKPGDYYGPFYWLFGKSVYLGSVLQNTPAWGLHYWPFSRRESHAVFDQSLDILGIEQFGLVKGRSISTGVTS